MEKIIENLKNHIVVCGYGRNGKKCCEELFRNKVSFIVIENNLQIIEQIKEKNYLYIFGNASEEATLQKANIKNAKAIITSLPIDADNVFVVLSARKINPDLVLISRASQQSSEDILKTAGANHVIMPELIGGHYMAALVSRPDLVEFYHFLTDDIDSSICTEEVDCSKLKDEYLDKAIADIGFRRKFGVSIIASRKGEGKFIVNPSPDMLVDKESILIVLGTKDQVNEMLLTCRKS